MGEERKEKYLSLRPSDSYTNLAAKRYKEQSGTPSLCSFQFAIPIIHTHLGFLPLGLTFMTIFCLQFALYVKPK